MSPAQARALLDSLKDQDQRVNLGDPARITTAKMNVCSKIGRRLWRAVWFAVLLSGGPGGVFAQQTGGSAVSAALEESTVDVGVATQFQISVVNGRADRPPPVPIVAGLTFQYVGQETNITNALSRQIEHAADAYGLAVTQDRVSMAQAFVSLSEQNLSDPYPPPFIRFWLSSHPPLGERITFALGRPVREGN